MHTIYASLQPATHRLLHTLCEVEVVHADALGSVTRAIDESGDAASLRVLLRVGLVQPIELDNTPAYSIPPDVREALAPIRETELGELCAAAYSSLRDTGLPAFRDVFPRGFGGNPLQAARLRLINCLVATPEPTHVMDRLLAVLRIFDTESGDIGELASMHLDVGGPDAFARQAIRSWLGSLDDSFTRCIVDPFGGDTALAADHLLAADFSDPSDPRNHDRELWAALLYQARAHLLFVLGILPAGHWFRTFDLARLQAVLFEQSRWHHGHFASLDQAFPDDALPTRPIGIDDDALIDDIATGLTQLFAEFLEPLGAIQRDHSGELFMCNPEALRAFREGDLGFDALWTAAESYLGHDIELWLPLPTDAGARIAGIASLQWVADSVAAWDGPTHLHDELALARWSTPVVAPGGVLYVFNDDGVSRGESLASDPEEFLLWLHARSPGGVPGRVRALFPISSSVVDADAVTLQAAIDERISALIEGIDNWSEHPPLASMEELRGWGNAAVPTLVSTVSELVLAEDWENPLLRHCALVLGELGAEDGCPSLLRMVAYSTSEILEGAAAMACARIGEPAVAGLIALLGNEGADVDKRLSAAATLSSCAVLHPILGDEIAVVLSDAIREPDIANDVATLLCIHLAETGHRDTEQTLYRLRDDGKWVDDLLPLDEAFWVASLSPAVWGHPFFAAPLAMVYPTSVESDLLSAESGVDALIEETGAREDVVLGGRAGAAWRKRNKRES